MRSPTVRDLEIHAPFYCRTIFVGGPLDGQEMDYGSEAYEHLDRPSTVVRAPCGDGPVTPISCRVVHYRRVLLMDRRGRGHAQVMTPDGDADLVLNRIVVGCRALKQQGN
jgi:hypothetical protein